jgi:uncharacterized protein YciI
MHYIYVLKVIERLIPDSAWTEADNAIVSRHFNKLVELKEEGKLVLAGRTTFEGPDSFGIVILKTSEEDARSIMLNDPAVKEGIMTANLYPYGVALISEDNA